MEHPSIIFKIVCPDRPGLVSLLTSWISKYGGNIKHSDHHTDQDAGLFLSRIEWNSNNEFFNRDEIYKEKFSKKLFWQRVHHPICFQFFFTTQMI